MIDALRRLHQGRPALARGLALLASAALAGSCYWPQAGGWPMWAALAPLLWLLEDLPPARAFRRAWLWGLVAWAAAMHWFFRVTLEYAAGPWAWRLALALGIIAYHGLMLAFTGLLTSWTARRLAAAGWEPRAALAAAFVPWASAMEGLFPQVYPACLAATQLNHLAAVQSLDLWGAGGLSLLVFGTNAALYAAWRVPGARRLALSAAAAAVLVNEAYGLVRMRQSEAADEAARAAGRTLRLSILQGDLPLKSRNTGTSAEPNIAFYRTLTAEAMEGAPELVVWPHYSYERVIRFEAGDPALERPGYGAGPLADRLKADVPFPVHALLSAPAQSPATSLGSWPSHHFVAVLKGPDGSALGSTAKVNPTPLAEKMPFGDWFPVLHRLAPKLKRVVPGESRLLSTADGRRLGVFICYDAVKTAPARRLAAAGAEVLVNPSSDQWSYDKASQPWQHLRIVVLRAVENRRWYARATPSGVSVVADATGRIVREIGVDVRGTATETVPLRTGRTPFMFLGDSAYYAAALAGLALAALGRRPT
jgi:apolipoprotein N-acyltransferase